MKNYGMPFKNTAIDKLGDKFGKDKPTQEVNFKANAEKRVAENIKKGSTYSETNFDDNNTKISSLKDPQSKTYISTTLDKKPLKGKDVYLSGEKDSKGNKKSYQYQKDAESNMATTAFYNKTKSYDAHWANSQQKMKTLAPSYVDPKGPSTLQGVKKKK